MESTSDIFKKIAKTCQKIVWFLGLHAFAVIIFIVFIEIIWGVFIFNKYVSSAQNKKQEIVGNIIKLDEAKFQNVLKELEGRE